MVSQYLCDTPDIAASGNNVYITFAKYKTGFADAYIMRNTQESDKKVLSDLSGM